jgi:hypothetical protein
LKVILNNIDSADNDSQGHKWFAGIDSCKQGSNKVRLYITANLKKLCLVQISCVFLFCLQQIFFSKLLPK